MCDYSLECVASRPAKVGDKLAANKAKGDESAKAMVFMARLIERPVEILAELDELDFDKLQEQYLAFTGRTETPES